MFLWRRDKADISGEDPIFNVRYIGNIETILPTGTGCTNMPLQKLMENASAEKYMRKITVQISVCGIFMNEANEKKGKLNISFTSSSCASSTSAAAVAVSTTGSSSTDPSKSKSNNRFNLSRSLSTTCAGDARRNSRHFAVEDISFCAADRHINDRIFCWIYRNPDSGKLFLHAVMCSGKDKAKIMAVVMSRAFNVAYGKWKCERQRSRRKKNKTISSTTTTMTTAAATTTMMKMKMTTPTTAASSGLDDKYDNDDDDNDDININKYKSSSTKSTLTREETMRMMMLMTTAKKKNTTSPSSSSTMISTGRGGGGGGDGRDVLNLNDSGADSPRGDPTGSGRLWHPTNSFASEGGNDKAWLVARDAA